MIKTLFQWFDSHPHSYWLIALIPTIALFWCAGFSVKFSQPRDHFFARRRVFWTLALLVMLAWRWPWMLDAGELNPDESQFIAGAITLTHDPVFWRSVDGMTAGPLVIYALLPLHWVGLPLDYFTARLVAILLILLALAGMHRTIRLHFGRGTAHATALPVLIFFATTSESNFTHYASELVTLPLLAWAAWALLPASPSEWPRQRAFFGGFCCGLLPWAKLQAAPIGAVLLLLAIGCAWRRRPIQAFSDRHLAIILAGAVLPSLAVVGFALGTGQVEVLWRSYIVQNFFYTDNHHWLWPVIARLAEIAVILRTPAFLLAAALVFTLGTSAVALCLRKRLPDMFWVGASLTFAAIICIFTPRRAFAHYLLLLPIPLGLWMGCCASLWREWLERRTFHASRAAAFYLAGMGAVLVSLRLLVPAPEMLGHLLEHWRKPRSLLGSIVHTAVRPGEAVAIWGYNAQIYVETRTRQATSDAFSYWAIVEHPQRDWYQDRFLQRVRTTRPAAFVDTVSSLGFLFTEPPRQAHEIFPALADYIEQAYTLYAATPAGRVYVRRDLASARHLGAATLRTALNQARRPLGFPNMPLEDLERFRLPRDSINGLEVIRANPPGELTWQLQGREREFYFDYGFDPRAYAAGAGGDGAMLEVRLTDPNGSSRVLFERFLDPKHNPSDRGNFSEWHTLPWFAPGSRLTIRTTAGPNNDDRWDWIYVGNCRFLRARTFTLEQFPGFNRLPDVADSALAYFSGENGRAFQVLHAPAYLGFNLHGKETQVSFDYGFLSSAYTAGGRTDGAVFRVEAWRPELPDLVLFEKKLTPVTAAADRGHQQVTIEIPSLPPHSTLGIRILTGEDAYYDSTYITDVQLQ